MAAVLITIRREFCFSAGSFFFLYWGKNLVFFPPSQRSHGTREVILQCRSIRIWVLNPGSGTDIGYYYCYKCLSRKGVTIVLMWRGGRNKPLPSRCLFLMPRSKEPLEAGCWILGFRPPGTHRKGFRSQTPSRVNYVWLNEPLDVVTTLQGLDTHSVSPEWVEGITLGVKLFSGGQYAQNLDT